MDDDNTIQTDDEFGEEFDGEFIISIERLRSSMLMFGYDVIDGVFTHFETGHVLRSRDGDPVAPDDRLVYLDYDPDEPHGSPIVPVKYDEATDDELAEWGWDDVDPDNPAEWGNFEDASWDEMKDAIGFESRFADDDDGEWPDPRAENSE